MYSLSVFRVGVDVDVDVGCCTCCAFVYDRDTMQPGTYNLHSKNCNHFADAFARELVGEG